MHRSTTMEALRPRNPSADLKRRVAEIAAKSKIHDEKMRKVRAETQRRKEEYEEGETRYEAQKEAKRPQRRRNLAVKPPKVEDAGELAELQKPAGHDELAKPTGGDGGLEIKQPSTVRPWRPLRSTKFSGGAESMTTKEDASISSSAPSPSGSIQTSSSSPVSNGNESLDAPMPAKEVPGSSTSAARGPSARDEATVPNPTTPSGGTGCAAAPKPIEEAPTSSTSETPGARTTKPDVESTTLQNLDGTPKAEVASAQVEAEVPPAPKANKLDKNGRGTVGKQRDSRRGRQDARALSPTGGSGVPKTSPEKMQRSAAEDLEERLKDSRRVKKYHRVEKEVEEVMRTQGPIKIRIKKVEVFELEMEIDERDVNERVKELQTLDLGDDDVEMSDEEELGSEANPPPPFTPQENATGADDMEHEPTPPSTPQQDAGDTGEMDHEQSPPSYSHAVMPFDSGAAQTDVSSTANVEVDMQATHQQQILPELQPAAMSSGVDSTPMDAQPTPSADQAAPSKDYSLNKFAPSSNWSYNPMGNSSDGRPVRLHKAPTAEEEAKPLFDEQNSAFAEIAAKANGHILTQASSTAQAPYTGSASNSATTAQSTTSNGVLPGIMSTGWTQPTHQGPPTASNAPTASAPASASTVGSSGTLPPQNTSPGNLPVFNFSNVGSSPATGASTTASSAASGSPSTFNFPNANSASTTSPSTNGTSNLPRKPISVQQEPRARRPPTMRETAASRKPVNDPFSFMSGIPNIQFGNSPAAPPSQPAPLQNAGQTANAPSTTTPATNADPSTPSSPASNSAPATGSASGQQLPPHQPAPAQTAGQKRKNQAAHGSVRSNRAFDGARSFATSAIPKSELGKGDQVAANQPASAPSSSHTTNASGTTGVASGQQLPSHTPAPEQKGDEATSSTDSTSPTGPSTPAKMKELPTEALKKGLGSDLSINQAIEKIQDWAEIAGRVMGFIETATSMDALNENGAAAIEGREANDVLITNKTEAAWLDIYNDSAKKRALENMATAHYENDQGIQDNSRGAPTILAFLEQVKKGSVRDCRRIVTHALKGRSVGWWSDVLDPGADIGRNYQWDDWQLFAEATDILAKLDEFVQNNSN